MTARDVEAILRDHDFVCVSQKGSHRKWRNAEQRLVAIVPDHGGRVLPIGTVRNIMQSAAIPESEWRE